jgi:hypothetical protein
MMRLCLRALMVGCLLFAAQGCSDDSTVGPLDGGADAAGDVAVTQPDTTPDVAITPDGPTLPDGQAKPDSVGQPDALPKPDGVAPKPDLAQPKPDGPQPKPDQGAACPPRCDKIGSKSEGWYTCGGKLIKWDSCNGCTAKCDKVGTKSEGWYSSCGNALIEWAQCG